MGVASAAPEFDSQNAKRLANHLTGFPVCVSDFHFVKAFGHCQIIHTPFPDEAEFV